MFGAPKTGKTAFAFSFPGPYYYQRLDRMADIIINDVLDQLEDTSVDEVDYISDIDPLNPRDTAPKLWKTFEQSAKRAIAEANERDARGEAAGTFIIDGGHRLWDICQDTWLPVKEDLPQSEQNRFRTHYATANEKITNIMLALEASPLHVVITHHTRPVYEGGTETTKVRPDGFKRIQNLNSVDLFLLTSRPDAVDTIRVMRSTVDKNSAPPATNFFSYISLCAYDPMLEGSTFKDLTFGKLYIRIFGEQWPEKVYDPTGAKALPVVKSE